MKLTPWWKNVFVLKLMGKYHRHHSVTNQEQYLLNIVSFKMKLTIARVVLKCEQLEHHMITIGVD